MSKKKKKLHISFHLTQGNSVPLTEVSHRQLSKFHFKRSYKNIRFINQVIGDSSRGTNLFKKMHNTQDTGIYLEHLV